MYGYANLGAAREEGREEGKLAFVLCQLRRAVGQILENDSQRTRRLDRDGLAALAEALLDSHATSDLTAWLKRHV